MAIFLLVIPVFIWHRLYDH